MWNQSGLLIFESDTLTTEQKTAIAQAFVDEAGLESLEDELLMFDKAADLSDDYGASSTHRAIRTALTSTLATAIETVGTDAVWYRFDSGGTLVFTTDSNKKSGETITHGFDWQSGVSVTAGEYVRYNGHFYRVLQTHTTQSDWTPDIAFALFVRYRAPGVVYDWSQPISTLAYPVGARVSHNGQIWTNTIIANVWEPGVVGWTPDAGGSDPGAWAIDQSVQIDDLRSYQGTVYRCLQAHTTIVTWYPSAPGILGVLWEEAG